MDLAVLKETITTHGKPEIWLTDEGWFFHEQKGAVKYSAEQILAVSDLSELTDPKPKATGKKKINNGL